MRWHGMLPHLLRALVPLICVFPATLFVRAPAAGAEETALEWQSDYGAAYAEAQAEGRMLLIYFEADGASATGKAFERTLKDAKVRRLCAGYTLLRLPTDYEVTIAEETTRLLDHGAFAAMQGSAGLAIVDLQNSAQPQYGHTVSAVPFVKPVYYAPEFSSVGSVRALLQLPAGTLTQRTMVYAVRLHPDKPASTRGRAEPILFAECAGHCAFMARTGVQGHQGFDERFQRVNARLGGGAASEVVSESWPGERLLAACFSCVHAWRGSPGHWNSVSSPQPAYGYDIRRGANGVWYATGLFGGR